MNGCCAECTHKAVCKVIDTFQAYLTDFDPKTGKCDCFLPEAKVALPHSIYEVALIDHISGISQSTYVIEECSELIKELMKEQRGKGSEENILAEACDVYSTRSL